MRTLAPRNRTPNDERPGSLGPSGGAPYLPLSYGVKSLLDAGIGSPGLSERRSSCCHIGTWILQSLQWMEFYVPRQRPSLPWKADRPGVPSSSSDRTPCTGRPSSARWPEGTWVSRALSVIYDVDVHGTGTGRNRHRRHLHGGLDCRRCLR
jgi:hypothetical protein